MVAWNRVRERVGSGEDKQRERRTGVDKERE